MMSRLIDADIKSLRQEITDVKMARAKQEALIDEAKARRREMIKKAKEMGYNNIRELPRAVRKLEEEIMTAINQIQDILDDQE